MIECRNLSYKISGKTIVDSATLSARDGEITVILGKNGSGKTTLIRAITAPAEHRKHIDGEVRLSGEDALSLTSRELASRISLVPQILPGIRCSVTDLVSLALLADRSPFSRLDDQGRRAVSDAIASVGLEPLADSSVASLSGGERQLAYIAMMMAKGAQNLVLDEPTSALDSLNREAVLAFLRKMKAKGRAVLAVLQDINDAVAIADRIVVIDRGRVIFDGTPEMLEKSDVPTDHFGLMPCRVNSGEEQFVAYFPKKQS